MKNKMVDIRIAMPAEFPAKLKALGVTRTAKVEDAIGWLQDIVYGVIMGKMDAKPRPASHNSMDWRECECLECEYRRQEND